MAAIMMPPNVVVGPPPTPPGYRPNYASRWSFVLGGIQTGVGILTVILTIVLLASKPYDEETEDVSYFFTGILYIAAGSCGIAAGRAKKSCQITSFMVMSIIAALCAVPDCLVTVSVPTHTHLKGLIYTMSVLFLIESVASIWSASICCRSVCCRPLPTTGIPVGYQAQTGQVLVAMPMVNPAHMSPQPVQGMPPSTPYGWQGAPAGMASPPSAPYGWQGAPAGMVPPPSAPYGWQGAPTANPENPVSYEELPPKY